MMKVDSQIEEMNKEFIEIFNRIKLARFSKAALFDLDKYLKKVCATANAQVKKLVPSHLHLLTQVTSCFFLLVQLVNKQKKGNFIAFSSQLNRAFNCLIAIRFLLISGFEETCRSITRNYLETIDVSLACFVDQEFAIKHWEEEDSEVFWKEKVGYGKIYHYVRNAFKLAGLPNEEIDEHIEIRKEQKTVLSSSVHSDIIGAFRSMLPPPLGYPDMLSFEPHGVISLHTADHIAAIINETFKYIVILLKIILLGKAPPGFEFPSKGKDLDMFFVQFLAFQEIYDRYELLESSEIIAPDFKEKVAGHKK